MADAAVESLIEYLREVQIHQADLIRNAKDLVDIDKLEDDLRLFRAFLRKTPGNHSQNDDVRRLVQQVRDVVYDVEDIINASMTEAADSNSKQYFLRAFQTSEVLKSTCRWLDSICPSIYGEKSRTDFTNISDGDERPRLSLVEQLVQALPHRQVNVVGIEDEAKRLIGYLTEEVQQLDILAVIGVAGLGKTTLAWKVFTDSSIKYEFPTRIWIYVSGQFTKKDIFISILKEFMELSEDMSGRSDVELATLVADHLQRRKFLIVMDDVWRPDDWKELRIAFPTSNMMGKVLITSRFEEVASFANPNRLPLKLRFLKTEESWLLFQQEVFGKCKCPLELEDAGKLISGQCHGLPLTIMVIAGMLVDMFSASDDMSSRAKAWWQLSEILAAYREKKPLDLLKEAISLSYSKLSSNLRECFLYLAVFPEDYEIPAAKLIHLWIAEGLIQQKGGSLEEIAENVLEDLITRNLVKIDKINSRGKVKTCRIHDMIRDLCRSEASVKDIYLREMTKPVVSEVRDCYRLCVHSDTDALEFLCSKPYGPRIRSFICFSRDEINLPLRNISAISAAFKLLRVLEATPIKFTKLPRNLYHMIHLKYISISFSLSILPAAFSKFWNIQTLIVKTTSYTLEVKADIFKMIQLRHFKTNASATLPESTASGESGNGNLQTLGTISPKCCTEKVFDRAPNLKKLSIRGQLVLLLGGKNGPFCGLKKLVKLEKLKLLNAAFYSTAEGRLPRLPRLPPASEFPQKLRTLTLSNTFLEWSHISTLGSLEMLEVLKLKDYAFVGKKWETSDGGFRNLEVLHIGCTNLVNWEALSHHFPKLRCLELRNCEELCDVPIGLAGIPSLQILDLYRTENAAASAVKVKEAKRVQAQRSTGAITFELSIFPPRE